MRLLFVCVRVKLGRVGHVRRIKEFFCSLCQWHLKTLPVWTGPDVEPPLGSTQRNTEQQPNPPKLDLKVLFPPTWRVEEKPPVVFSWRGAAEAADLPGLASQRTEGGGESVWNSPGSCVSHGLMGNSELAAPHLSRR